MEQSQFDSSVKSTTGRLKRELHIPSIATVSVNEKGRKILTLKCNVCQNVIRVGEAVSHKKPTSKVCFTIPEEEEEEEEMPLRNVKPRTHKGSGTEDEVSNLKELAGINENNLSPREKELLGIAKEALKELFAALEPTSGPESK